LNRRLNFAWRLCIWLAVGFGFRWVFSLLERLFGSLPYGSRVEIPGELYAELMIDRVFLLFLWGLLGIVVCWELATQAATEAPAAVARRQKYKLRFTCGLCRHKFDIETEDPDAEGECPRCGIEDLAPDSPAERV